MCDTLKARPSGSSQGTVCGCGRVDRGAQLVGLWLAALGERPGGLSESRDFHRVSLASRIGGHRYPHWVRRVPFKCQGNSGVGIMRIHLRQDGNNVLLDFLNNLRIHVRIVIFNIVLPSGVLINIVAIKKRGQFPKLIVTAPAYCIKDSFRFSYPFAGLELIVDIRFAWTC